ncbi:MAG TPA: hypothetical protein VF719_13160, partial [Abditibacteriaceae bacterium]
MRHSSLSRISSPALRRGIALYSVVLCSAVLPQNAHAKSGAAFSMVENSRFGALAKGLPGAVSVEVTGARNATEFAAARSTALKQTQIDKQLRNKAAQTFRRMGALGKHTPLSRTRIVAYTRNGALPERKVSSTTQSPVSTRSTSTSTVSTKAAPLTFKYSGFTSQQIIEFSAFRDRVYPLMVALYGEPAPSQAGKIVIIQNDNSAGDGVYELPPSGSSTSGGTIRYDPIAAGNGTTAAQALAVNNYNLSRQMLIAFHGAQIFAFDAWELGFTDAAALIVNYQTNPVASFDPSQLGVYLMPAYDLLNRPELGNPAFFTQSSSASVSPNLGFYRAGMAQAAWLKVWVENPDFFRLFNAQYYAQYNNTGAVPLRGNTPALKFIAQSLAPTVEGQTFTDWYRRQYVLDTAVTTGEKLWVGVVPQLNLTSGDTRSVFFGIAQRYRTLADGGEQPLSGTGTLGAFDETGEDVAGFSDEMLNGGTVVQFNALGEAELNSQNSGGNLPIIGFRGTGTPDMGRIRLALRIGEAEATAYFPYNVAGTEAVPNGYYGSTLGADMGTLGVRPVGATTATSTWRRGAFKSPTRYRSGPRVRTDFILAPTGGGAAKTIRRNSTWSYFGGMAQPIAVLLETPPSDNSFPLNVTRTATNGLRMISLPLYPYHTDEATVLGVDRTKLLLARYRPNLSPKGFTQNGITYGVTADKYELYPNIAEPFAPGRGYWLKLNADLATTVRGGEPPRDKPFEVPLIGGENQGGWNQIGVPF